MTSWNPASSSHRNEPQWPATTPRSVPPCSTVDVDAFGTHFLLALDGGQYVNRLNDDDASPWGLFIPDGRPGNPGALERGHSPPVVLGQPGTIGMTWS